MAGGSSGVALWAMSAAGASAVVGLGWVTQTVEIPVVWVLILTFVPTRDLTDCVRRVLDGVVSRVDGGSK